MNCIFIINDLTICKVYSVKWKVGGEIVQIMSSKLFFNLFTE